MRRAINGFLWFVGLFVVLVAYFMVPVGQFTLYEHTLRIGRTEPAQDLREDMAETGRQIGQSALDEWEDRRPMRSEATPP